MMDSICKWSFIIDAPYDNYMRGLVEYLPNNDIVIYEEDYDYGPTYYFSSIHLNQLDYPDNVYNVAQKLKLLIDGTSFLIYENKNDYIPIQLGTLINNLTNQTFRYERILLNSKFDVDFTKNPTSPPPKGHIVSDLVFIAKTEEFIAYSLYILGNGISYIALYKVLDEVKHFLGSKGDNLQKLGFSDKKISRFTRTANNYETLGLMSRHGRQNHVPPEVPMSLDESSKLITEIMREILYRYFNLSLPVQPSFKIKPEDLF